LLHARSTERQQQLLVVLWSGIRFHSIINRLPRETHVYVESVHLK